MSPRDRLRGRPDQSIDGFSVRREIRLDPEPVEFPEDFADARARGDAERDDILAPLAISRAPRSEKRRARAKPAASARWHFGVRKKQRVGNAPAAEREQEATQGVGGRSGGDAVEPGERGRRAVADGRARRSTVAAARRGARRPPRR